jgi:hypothetical protein
MTITFLDVLSEKVHILVEEYIPTGWVKIKRDNIGTIITKNGPHDNTFDKLRRQWEIEDDIHLCNLTLKRHEEYKAIDDEIYFNNYTYLWEEPHIDFVDTEDSDSGYDSELSSESDYYEDF